MELSVRYATCILAVLGFVLPQVHAAPPSSGIVGYGSSIDYGSHCQYWIEPVSSGTYKFSLECGQVGRGIKAQGSIRLVADEDTNWTTSWTDKNSLGSVQSVNFNVRDLKQATFRVNMAPSGNADMGSCTTNLVEIDQLIKNAWVNILTCSDISPHLRVRAVLDIPGAINQRTKWLKAPGTVETLPRESWWGKPSAIAEWDIRRDYLPD